MVRFLISIFISFAAFICGVLAFEVFYFGSKPVFDSSGEEISVVEIQPLVENQSVIAIQLSENKQSDDEDIEIVGDQQSQSFAGWYSLENYKGMNEVNMISLSANYADDKTENGKMTYDGGVFTSFENYGDLGFFDSASADINGNQVKFRTKKIKGIEYRFEGVFFGNKTPEPQEKTLRGTLQKFVKGKKVAEVSGEFVYHEPHCWH